MVLGEGLAASRWTVTTRLSGGGRLGSRPDVVAGVAQSAERFTRKYLGMSAVVRIISAGRR